MQGGDPGTKDGNRPSTADRLKAEEAEAEREKDKANSIPNVMADLIWHDVIVDSQKLGSLKRFQRVNHFPTMHGITKKSELAENLSKMKDLYP